MSKSKNVQHPHKDVTYRFDRILSKERSVCILRKKLSEVADFYGFLPVYSSIVDNHKSYSVLAKAGLLDERQFLICKNKNGNPLTLRPGGVLSALRVYLNHQMADLPHPVKLVLNGENISYSKNKESGGMSLRPEWNLLAIGENGPVTEAEIFQVIWRALQESGMVGEMAEVRVNAWGCTGCKPTYRSTLVSYLRSRGSRLCKSCKGELRGNPANIFNCQEEKCKIVANNAPIVLDFLCDACKKYLKSLLEFLDELSLPYLLDSRFFRPDSWYGNVMWEMRGVLSPKNGEVNIAPAKIIFGEGGCISKAAETMMGKPTEAFAGTVFLDNLESFMFQENMPITAYIKPKVFLTQLGDLAKRKSFGLLEELRKAGIAVAETLGRDAIKSQLKTAETVGAEIALILGQKEALDRTVIVRDVQSSMQETIPQEKLIDFLQKKLGINQ